MKRAKRLLLLIPAVLLLTGCFAIENGLVVNEDGSGSQTIRFAVPAEVLSSMGETLPDTAEMEDDEEVRALREALGDRGSMTFFSNPTDGVGFELQVLVDPSDDVAAALRARADEIAASVGDDSGMDMSMLDIAGDEITLRREGDEWVFEMRMASLDLDALGALTGDPEAAGMAGLFMDQTAITNTLRLPGEVIEHNADEVREDGTLVWTQTGSGGDRILSARSDVGSGGLSTLAMAGLLIGGIAVVLAGAGFLLFGRRRGVA